MSGDTQPWQLKFGKHDLDVLCDFVERYAERATTAYEPPGCHFTQAIITFNDKGYIGHLYFTKAWGTSYELFSAEEDDRDHFSANVTTEFACSLLRTVANRGDVKALVQPHLVTE